MAHPLVRHTQLTAFISILVVFSVMGINQGIFGPGGSQLAIGAGWLLLAIANVSLFLYARGLVLFFISLMRSPVLHILNNVPLKLQILWLLFITADDETRLALVFSSYASEVTPNRTRSMMRQSRRTSSALGISSNNANGSVTDFHSQHTHGSPHPGNNHINNMNGGYGSHNTLGGGGGGGMNTYASGGSGTYGLAGGMGKGVNTAPQSLHSMPSHANMNNNNNNGAGYANGSPVMGGRATPVQQQQQQPIMQQQQQMPTSNAIAGVSQSAPVQMHPSSTIPASIGQQAPTTAGQAAAQQQTQQPTAAGAAAATGIAGAGAGANAGQHPTAPPFEMKAAFSYTASADDPNEISFVKGEIMTILDNSGKWFNARKQDGQEGIVPRYVLSHFSPSRLSPSRLSPYLFPTPDFSEIYRLIDMAFSLPLSRYNNSNYLAFIES